MVSNSHRASIRHRCNRGTSGASRRTKEASNPLQKQLQYSENKEAGTKTVCRKLSPNTESSGSRKEKHHSLTVHTVFLHFVHTDTNLWKEVHSPHYFSHDGVNK